MKDFVVDPYQILDAAARGADAVLLLAALLSETEIQRFVTEARLLGLDALVEVHDEAELVRSVRAGATLVGINNREPAHLRGGPRRLDRGCCRTLPRLVTAVAESGLSRPEDLARLRETRCDAVLMGEVFMTSADPAATLAALAAAARGARVSGGAGATAPHDRQGLRPHARRGRRAAPCRAARTGSASSCAPRARARSIPRGHGDIVAALGRGVARRGHGGASAPTRRSRSRASPAPHACSSTACDPAALAGRLPAAVRVRDRRRRRPATARDALPAEPHLVLLDTAHATLAGGTGTDVPVAGGARASRAPARVMLAGGLDGDNVADGDRAPRGRSGWTRRRGSRARPGIKDHDKVRRFVAAVRECDAGTRRPA